MKEHELWKMKTVLFLRGFNLYVNETDNDSSFWKSIFQFDMNFSLFSSSNKSQKN